MKPAILCGVAGGALVLGVQIGRRLPAGGSGPAAAPPDAREAPPHVVQEAEPCCKGSEAPQEASGAGLVQTKLIDGKAIAAQVREEVKALAAELRRDHGVLPGLAVILVGSRKDSQSYVRNKKKAAAEVDFHTVDVDLPETVSEEALLAEVEKLNADPKVHAILVQLPLPKHISEAAVLKAISVEKDADGFSAVNIGNLCLKGGDPPLAVPCTPAGCVELLQRSGVHVGGKNAVVIGRSNIVGMPVSQLLQSMDATVTVCHSRTANMEAYVRNADILIAAIGKAEFVPGRWLKPGCVVIDVGINAVEDSSKKLGHRLVGDVNFKEAQGVASMITPVPGGVGPMTIAMLLKNTLNLARHSLGLSRVPLRKASKVAVASLPQAQAAGPASALAAAKADGVTPLPAGQDLAVVMSCRGGDVWAAAVAAGALRERVKELSPDAALPAVVVHASGVNGNAPVALATLSNDASQRRVLCSAASVEEAAAALTSV